MHDWACICGNYVRDKRFCPRCKLVRFRLENGPILDYWGVRLGQISDGLPFNFPIDLLTNHVLISGQTGTGKTRAAMNLAVKSENLQSPQRMNLLIIDIEGEWRKIIPKLKNNVEYFAVDKNLKINPFDLGDPALIRELMRETVFKGIEKEYVDLSAQMSFVLQETISESKSMEDLMQNIKNYERQKLTGLDKTKTALLVRLDPFMRSPLKEIFFCKKSNPDFSKLDEKNTIIDLHALDALVAYGSEIRLIYNTITTYFLRKMLSRETYSLAHNLFVADEAQLLVPRILHKMVVTESWPATEFATRLRKRGCGMLLITQSPSNIEPDILKNTATKVSFRLQSQEDIKVIADSCGFTDMAEYGYLADRFVRLPKKTAIVCTANHEPFLVMFDDFGLDSFQPVAEHEPEKTPDDNDQSKDEIKFLGNISEKPFLSVTERRIDLGWNDKKYSQVVDELIKKGMIQRVSASLGRGTPRILYQRPNQRPGIRHEFYVNWIANRLAAKGMSVTKSKDGPDMIMPEISAAIEVELGSSNMDGNIRRDLHQFRNVIVCSDQKEVIKALSAKFKSNGIFLESIQNVPALVEKMRAGNELKDF